MDLKIDNLLADLFGNAVPDPLGLRPAVFQCLEFDVQASITPAFVDRTENAGRFQRALGRKMRPFYEPDDLEAGCLILRAPHLRSIAHRAGRAARCGSSLPTNSCLQVARRIST